MNTVLIATAGGLFTGLCWGIADWLMGKNTKKFNIFEVNFTIQVVGGIFEVPLLLLPRVQLPSLPDALTIIVASTLIAVAYLIFVKALSSGLVGIVVPLSSIYPLITLLLSIVFLNSHFKGLHVVAMVSIILGAITLAYEKNHKKIPVRDFHKETILALSATVIWGFAFFLLNPVVGRVAWQAIVGLSAVASSIFASIVLVVTQRSRTKQAIKSALTNKTIFLTAMVYVAAAIVFYSSSAHGGSLVIPLVLAASSPLIASILAAIFDKEKLGIIKRVGAVIIVAGIVILNIA